MYGTPKRAVYCVFAAPLSSPPSFGCVLSMAAPSLPRLQPAPCHSPLHRALRASSVWSVSGPPPVICPGVARWPRRRSPASRCSPPPFGPPSPSPLKSRRVAPARPGLTPSHRAHPVLARNVHSRSGARYRSQAAAAAPATGPPGPKQRPPASRPHGPPRPMLCPHGPYPNAPAALTAKNEGYLKARMTAPTVTKKAPKNDFKVTDSPNHSAENSITNTTLNRSTGTTLDASPSCSARK